MPDCSCCPSPTPPVERALSRRHLLIGGAAATGALALSSLPAGATTESPAGVAAAVDHPESQTRDFGFLEPRPANEVHTRPIMFPVLGPVSWTDTYLAPRGGGRRHEGQDLMGNKMLKLLSCVAGTVVELRHESGGNSLYIKGDDGWYYCYLHINNDTPGTDDGRNPRQYAFASGLAIGSRVKKGQHVAYLGDSGNAEGSGSHLHFEIRMPHANWYNAAAVNAKYSLNAAAPAREGPAVPPETFTPWDTSRDLVTRQFRDLLGRAPSATDLAYWSELLDSGNWSPQQMMAFMLEGDECDGRVHAVTRLYQAYFLRRPDLDGFTYWIGRRRSGTALSRISEFFATSDEFVTRYGDLGDEAFVDRIYRNVLGRAPDQEGMAYWMKRLAGGSSRGWVMVQFSESPEYRGDTDRAVQVIGAFGCMLRRMPSADDITIWSPHSNGNMLHMMRLGEEYARVVATTN
ncbi:MAG TPA: DUF4214 domain-containing protein [Acidimicrobiales bacterium]|nr:DUF4214 domain-containing protein [Acidimicrobiales bacterium]